MKSRYFLVFLGLLFLVPFFTSQSFTDPFLVPRMLYFQGMAAILLVVGLFVFRSKQGKLSFTFPDLLLLAFVLYISLSTILIDGSTSHNLFFISWVLLVGVYFLVKEVLKHGGGNGLILIGVLLICGMVEAGFGVLQHFNLIDNGYSNFGATGTWLNPGPYAIYLSSTLPFVLALFLFRKKTWIKKLSGIILLIILIALPLTESRTGWIAAFLGCGVVILSKYYDVVATFFKHRPRALTLIILGCVILGFAGYELYQYKIDSVHGRLNIYQTAWNIFMDHPLLGVGFDNYAPVHSEYQSAYFHANPEINEVAYSADNVEYVFNEYLQMLAELGIIGLLVFLVLIFFLGKLSLGAIRNSNRDPILMGAIGSLIGIMTSALFSYPFHEVSILVILILDIAIISSVDSSSIFQLSLSRSVDQAVKFGISLMCVWFLWSRFERANAEMQWKRAYAMLQRGNVGRAMEEYEAIYPVMKQNELFLFNYGAELSYQGQYQKSITILTETLPRLNDQDVQLFLAMSYWGNGDKDLAEQHFIKAIHIIPYKYLPRYRLMLFYLNNGEQAKAQKQAKLIADLQPKVPSETVDQIKKEANNVLEK